MRFSLHQCAALASFALCFGCGSSEKTPASGGNGNTPPPPPGPPGCGLEQAAFCDTFDTPSPGGRNGDLSDRWSVARISNINNLGQGEYNLWGSTTTEGCGSSTAGVMPPGDMFFCSGGASPSMHFNNAYNDEGGFTIHSYRINQPFDFTNRTGIIAFDATAKGTMPGGHGFWFNIFISDLPSPAPYQAGQFTALFVKAGLGIEFQSVCSQDASSNTVTRLFIEEDYDIVREIPSPPHPHETPCFTTRDDAMNHVEVHISQTRLEVFASDAGQPETLRSIWVADNLSLPLTKGYLNLAHTHYNASKCTFTSASCQNCENDACPTFPAYETYGWDNVAFDGPRYPAIRSYEAPDNTAPSTKNLGNKFPGPYVNLGYALGTSAMDENKRGILATGTGMAAPLPIAGVDLTGASAAMLTFNAWSACAPIQYRFNGGTWRTFDPPFPDCSDGARSIAIPLNLADIVPGDNSLEMYVDTDSLNGWIVANLDLTILVE